VYRKGEEEAQSVRKAVEGCRSSRKCSMSCFSSLSENGTKTQGGADGSEECRERQGLPRKRRLGSEEAKRLAEDKVWVQKAPEVQWKCRQPSGSGRKTAGGNRSARKSVGRNQSEALGLGCRDKSGIGAVATTFLFRGCQRKKCRKKNCRVQLPDCRELREKKRKSLGVPRKDRKCRERHKTSRGRVGGAMGQKGPRVGNH